MARVRHLFYYGWEKKHKGRIYIRWVHSNCCWCNDDFAEKSLPLKSNEWLLPDTPYVWKSTRSVGYWGDVHGNPIDVDDILGVM